MIFRKSITHLTIRYLSNLLICLMSGGRGSIICTCVLYVYENSFHNLSLQWAFEILIRTPIPISDMDVWVELYLLTYKADSFRIGFSSWVIWKIKLHNFGLSTLIENSHFQDGRKLIIGREVWKKSIRSIFDQYMMYRISSYSCRGNYSFLKL